jgi:16S rRNA (cytosine1402-N4)-methyltransferase
VCSEIHKPVMLTEVLEALSPTTGCCYADGTVGAGGHSKALLGASTPKGFVYGCDRDSAAVQIASERLAEFAGRFEFRVSSFAELASWLGPDRCEGVLLDLGISSVQLNQADRGFSFLVNGPLDMRLDRRQSLTAASIVNEAPAAELARIFWEYGGERQSRKLANAIDRERKRTPFETTLQLASLIERVVPRHGQRIHPATRVFQALRIEANDELGQLKKGLDSAWTILKPGGRLAVITFHSLEVRAVKAFGRNLARDYTVDGDTDIPELRRPKDPELKWVSSKGVVPSAAEVEENPRARSAQLRVMEKL